MAEPVFFLITLMQKWEWVRVIPSDLPDWEKFITPEELRHILTRNGLVPLNTMGMMPELNPVASIKRLLNIRKVKRGTMSYAELGRGLVFRPSRFFGMNYMGHAIK